MSKNIDKKTGTISFSISKNDYIEMANDCLDNDEFNEAIMHANNAYDLGKDRELFFIMPQAYYSLDNQEMALACVAELMASYRPTRVDLEYLSGCIAGCLDDRGRHLAAFHFLNVYGTNEDFEITETMIEDTYKDLIERAAELKKPKLQFADAERIRYNGETLLRAHKLIVHDDYEGALQLIKSLYDTESDRYERIRAEALVQDALGNRERVLEIARIAIKLRPTQGILPDFLHYKNSYPEVVDLFKLFRFSDDDVAMKDVASLANRYGEFEYAQAVVDSLIDSHPNAICYRIMQALIRWNRGEKEQSKKKYFALLYTMRVKYPVDYIERLRFPDYLEIGKIVPDVFDKRIFRMVSKDLKELNGKKMSESLKRAIVYLFTDYNYEYGADLIKYFDNLHPDDEHYLMKRLNSDINTPKPMKRFFIKAMVYKGYKGKFFYNADGYYMHINIKRPPSYESYDDLLREAYADSFSLLADGENSCHKYLIPIYEKINQDEEHYNLDMSKLARAAICVALEEHGAQQILLEDYCTFNGIDISGIDFELDYIRALMGRE